MIIIDMNANPTLLRMKYARIVELFAEWSGLNREQALNMFYDSKTYLLISQGISDMHCMSDEYLVEELYAEQRDEKKRCFLT